MKKEFSQKPESITEQWPGELEIFSWQDFLTSIPSALFLVTTYKSNGKENACLQSWSSFLGDSGEFICILGSVSKGGHLHQSLKETKCCVINFPSKNLYDKCFATINNNDFEDQEISQSGLTAEKAISVNAPRIQECFLNIECELLWEHEHFEDSNSVTVALKTKHICMDTDKFDENGIGRYGESGYLFYIIQPRNPETGEVFPDYLGSIHKM